MQEEIIKFAEGINLQLFTFHMDLLEQCLISLNLIALFCGDRWKVELNKVLHHMSRFF
jgi:hypothetical protein